MSQCIVFCRTNVDCNALEDYLNQYSGGGGQKRQFRGKVESGKENKYSCCVMAGEWRVVSVVDCDDGWVRAMIRLDWNV
jgi:ATP-dependent RNA helicase DDX1